MTEKIQLGHGGGGRLSGEFVRDEILTRFGNGPLAALPDGAELAVPGGERLIFTTDSFVVRPLEFPGGSIGDLAVHGTVNDICVSGGRPMFLSLALIIEEGFPMDALRRILDRIKAAADECEVTVVTGDSKVVAKGECDEIFINTAGIGAKIAEFNLTRDRLNVGDRVLVSGPVGDHGMAVMASREGVPVSNGPVSDVGSVRRLTTAAAPFAAAIKFMRDPTRGGVAAVLNEMVAGSRVGIRIVERDVPVSPLTRGLAEMLGLSPLSSACEGRVVMVCAAEAADGVLDAWRALPEGAGARQIGEVTDAAGRVAVTTLAGGERALAVPQDELLPRIC